MTLNKTLGATALLALLSVQLQAQPIRLFSGHHSKRAISQGQFVLVPTDSFRVVYNTNNVIGSAQQYLTETLNYDTTHCFKYNGTGSNVSPSKDYIRLYDAQGRLIEMIGEEVNASTTKTTFTYSTNGDTTTVLKRMRMTPTSLFYDAEHYADIYDANKNIIRHIEYNVSNPNIEHHTINQYNSNQQVESTLRVKMTLSSQQVDSIWRYTYRYANGMADTFLQETYDQSNSVWKNASLISYHYDFNNNLDTERIQTWQASAGWNIGYKVIRTYDLQDRVKLRWVYNYDPISNTWFGVNYREKYAYDTLSSHDMIYFKEYKDSSGRPFIITDAVTSTFDSHSYLHRVRTQEILSTNTSTPTYITADSTEYIYNLLFPSDISTTEKTTTDFSIYPNPATTTLQLNVALSDDQPYSIAVYDMTGRMLQSQQAPAGKQQHTIQVGNLTAGQYLIEVRTQHNKMVKPFVITP